MNTIFIYAVWQSMSISTTAEQL